MFKRCPEYGAAHQIRTAIKIQKITTSQMSVLAAGQRHSENALQKNDQTAREWVRFSKSNKIRNIKTDQTAREWVRFSGHQKFEGAWNAILWFIFNTSSKIRQINNIKSDQTAREVVRFSQKQKSGSHKSDGLLFIFDISRISEKQKVKYRRDRLHKTTLPLTPRNPESECPLIT